MKTQKEYIEYIEVRTNLWEKLPIDRAMTENDIQAIEEIVKGKYFVQIFLELGTQLKKFITNRSSSWIPLNLIKIFIMLCSKFTPCHNEEIRKQDFLPFKPKYKSDHSTSLNFIIVIYSAIFPRVPLFQKRIIESIKEFVSNNPEAQTQQIAYGFDVINREIEALPQNSPLAVLCKSYQRD